MASHLIGNELQEMIQHFEAGRIQEATHLHTQILPLCKALFSTANPIPLKAALRLLGWDVGGCRLPLCDAPPEVITELEQAMVDLELI